jgi:ABC-type transporter MlaC component
MSTSLRQLFHPHLSWVVLWLSLLMSLPLGPSVMADPAPTPSTDAAGAVQFVKTMINGMIDISKHPTRERRAHYESLIANAIDWDGPAKRILGASWSALSAEDRRKLADWSRDVLLDADFVMEFIQNLIFPSCVITGRSPEENGATVRFFCTRFGNEPNFSLRLQVQRRGDRFQIVDVSYIGISFIEAMGNALLEPEAIAKHGVHIEAGK